jgi:hypothetical protein
VGESIITHYEETLMDMHMLCSLYNGDDTFITQLSAALFIPSGWIMDDVLKVVWSDIFKGMVSMENRFDILEKMLNILYSKENRIPHSVTPLVLSIVG